jgi:hypothetical protein
LIAGPGLPARTATPRNIAASTLDLRERMVLWKAFQVDV